MTDILCPSCGAELRETDCWASESPGWLHKHIRVNLRCWRCSWGQDMDVGNDVVVAGAAVGESKS